MTNNFKIYYLSLLFFTTNSLAESVNEVVATINVGVTPAGIAITADSKYAYVANNNNYSVPGQYSVSVVNLQTNLVEKVIFDSSFNEPYTVTINPAGTRAYVTNSNSSTVTIIDTASNTVIGVIPGFDGPSGMVITPNGATGYVNNYGGPGGVGSGNGTTISIVDLNANAIVGTIVVGLAPASLDITPNGAFVYVINYVDGNPGTGTISIIRTIDNVVVGTIPGFSGPFAIAITPNGRFAYVTNFGSNNFAPFGTTVSAVDLNTNTIIATIPVGIQPAGVDITPDSKFAYITNYNTLYAGPGFTNLTPGQGTVNIIDIATNRVLPPTIADAESPRTVAISPNGQFAYISNYISNTVSVIAVASFNVSVTARKVCNRFLTHTELINELKITSAGSSTPVTYLIYSDANLTNLIASAPAKLPTTIFLVRPTTSNTYYVVATDASGISSNPVQVII